MRRKDKEVTEREGILDIMRRCDVCRLALHDEEYPYILPLNFGVHVLEEQITLYFHGATEGKKYELLRRNNRVGFEMDCSHKLVIDPIKGFCTMQYESVIGHGVIEMVTDAEEKTFALGCLLRQYQTEREIPQAMIPRITVMKLTVADCTGKSTI